MPTIAGCFTGHAQASSRPAFTSVPLITNTKASERRHGLLVGSARHEWIEELLMNTKLFASTIVAASLLAAPVAFAQTETTAPPPASNNMEATPPAAQHTMKSSQIKSSQGGHFQQGTTTGLGSQGAARARPGGQSVARKPAD